MMILYNEIQISVGRMNDFMEFHIFKNLNSLKYGKFQNIIT